MRDAAGEPSHRVHLLRLAELLLEISSLGEIDRDPDDAEQSALFVEDRRGGEERRESLPEFALHQELPSPALAGCRLLMDFVRVIVPPLHFRIDPRLLVSEYGLD